MYHQNADQLNQYQDLHHEEHTKFDLHHHNHLYHSYLQIRNHQMSKLTNHYHPTLNLEQLAQQDHDLAHHQYELKSLDHAYEFQLRLPLH